MRAPRYTSAACGSPTRDLHAVDGIDLEIRRGEIFALLGPNGAGKTTTVEILEGYRARDGGDVTVLGYDPGRQRQPLKSRIGIVLQSTGVDLYLTVAETIAMYSSYYPHPRPVDEVIALVGLEAKRDARVVKLSGGQQRRLDVAIALAGDPELLFLDEPTTGFDPSARREAWDVVKSLATLGKTVLLTTHFMDEAQYLADRVAVIAAGRIVAEGTPATIAGRDLARARIRYRLPDGPAPPGDLSGEPAVRQPGRPDGFTEFAPDDLTRGAAPPHRLGHRAARRAGRAADHPAVSRGRLPAAHRPASRSLRTTSTTKRPQARTETTMNAPALTRLAGPLREQGVLAQPGVGVLHVRVPPHVPGDLHVAAWAAARCTWTAARCSSPPTTSPRWRHSR